LDRPTVASPGVALSAEPFAPAAVFGMDSAVCWIVSQADPTPLSVAVVAVVVRCQTFPILLADSPVPAPPRLIDSAMPLGKLPFEVVVLPPAVVDRPSLTALELASWVRAVVDRPPSRRLTRQRHYSELVVQSTVVLVAWSSPGPNY
jgi:hypothetical protein